MLVVTQFQTGCEYLTDFILQCRVLWYMDVEYSSLRRLRYVDPLISDTRKKKILNSNALNINQREREEQGQGCWVRSRAGFWPLGLTQVFCALASWLSSVQAVLQSSNRGLSQVPAMVVVANCLFSGGRGVSGYGSGGLAADQGSIVGAEPILFAHCQALGVFMS